MAYFAKITKMRTAMTRRPVKFMVNLLPVNFACTTRIVPMASLAKVTKMKTVMTRVPVQRWTIQ